MSELVIYRSDAGTVEVRLEGDTVWLRQEQLSQLFGRDRTMIGRHVRNVFKEAELDAKAVCANFAHCWFGQACRVLQPRRHHLGRLPGQVARRRALGDAGGDYGMSAMPDSGFAEIVDLIVTARQRAVQTVNATLIDLSGPHSELDLQNTREAGEGE